MRPSRFRVVFLITAMALLVPPGLRAQPFNSGSNGSDGALNLTTPGTIIFDPKSFSPPLDPDGDNVFHFTSITIGPGVTVRLRGPELNMNPVFWLASGTVQIEGTIDLNGAPGHDGTPVFANRQPSIPGAGGYPGGVASIPGAAEHAGSGPGGGRSCGHGGGAGHAGTGCGCGAGPAYGNSFLIPLLGGSGGAGGNATYGGGGGAGGGAILVASSVSIAVNGTITANGGNSGTPSGNGGWGGSGSGGAIHLLAPSFSGAGMLRVQPGSSAVNCSSAGRIRVEAFQHLFTGSFSQTPSRATPFTRNLTPTALPSLRVVSVDGLPVATDPTGSFTVPDVTINKGTSVTVAIEARNIPPGTVVKLILLSEGGADQFVDSTPLAGTVAQSTATASVAFPPGFSRGFVRAVWTP